MDWYYKKNKNYRPALIALVTLIVILLGIKEYNRYQDIDFERTVRANIYEQLIGKKSQLEKALYSRIYYTKSVAAYVGINSKIDKSEFKALATEFKKGDSVINTLSISKDCIITYIYPEQGHTAAIGLDLLTHPERKVIVEKTIETHQAFVAGPLNLVEGGIAIISYTPIFINNNSGEKNKFWGVTDIVIKRDELFKEAKLVREDGLNKYALKGIDGKGENGSIFWGDSSIFRNNPVKIDISLPTGNWVLASIPKSGWQNISRADNSYILYISALIISLLTWLLANALIRLSNNERELKAIFASMKDLIIEFNAEGDYIKIAPTSENYLILPRKELLGKNIKSVFNNELTEIFFNAIQKCIATKELQIIEYKMRTHTDEEFWFQARVSYISDDSVIFLANDNTFKKNAEIELIESENRLQVLNNQKDKFFSIIAHDLRNPLSSLKTVIETMNIYYDTFDENERKEYLQMLQKSTNTLYNLLENLLTWSRSQRGKINFTPELQNISFIIENCITSNSQNAKNKSISIISKLEHHSEIEVDANMIATVVRNLISNAIKFTPKDGKIEVSSSESVDCVQISIKDNGVGMEKSTIDKLFRIDTQVTSLGTNREVGTGLGLILCKEFVDKHNGTIDIKSEIGKGSEFIITLPKAYIK